jgi:pimeloyl-ACP methyl ester carboxylesterase
MDRVILTLVCCLVLLSTTSSPAAEPALGLHLAPCALGRTKTLARCGTFGVYEDRVRRGGRIIGLNLIVVPAKHPAHRALAEITGGPGEAATGVAAPAVDGYFSARLLALHDDYDLIFMDDRGMGKSNPFPCNFAPVNDPATYLRYLYPPKLVADCRAQSARTHDISAYDTNDAVDDLDDIRAALGYDKIVLDGGSYGTFFSLVYLRRHAPHVESAVLDGVAPPGFQPLPGEPLGAQTALADLFAKCRSDASCNARFPQFEQHFQALMHRFDAGPISVPVTNTATKRTQTVALSKEVFVDEFRHVLYSTFGASYAPYVIERSYRKDYAPLGRMMQTVVLGFADDLNMGAYLSYSCAEFMPFISPSALQYAKTHSFAGDLRIKAQQQACAAWNVPAMPASFNEPVHSQVPVLMILGSDDPATPAKFGQAALRYLPNARAILVAGGGHGADTPCTDKLVLEFVRTHSAKDLNLAQCSATLKLPPFAASMKGWPL